MKGDTRQAAPRQPASPPVTRSPNYPFVDLRTAVDRARAVYAWVDRRPTGRDQVARFWNLSPKSSTFRLTLAAVRAFGLFEYQSGTEDRLLKLSELALDIVVDHPENSPQWCEALKRAARQPAQHAELWEKYGDHLPDHEEIRRHLVRVQKFKDNAVGEFIKEYRSTLSYAGLLRDGDGQDGGSAEDQAHSPSSKVSRGDYIQWTSQGVGQFRPPRRVLEIVDDGAYLYVEGSKTAIPTAQVTVVEPPVVATPSPRTSLPRVGVREDVCTLDEGQAILRWPGRLSNAGYQDFKDWLDLIARKAKRLIPNESLEAGS